MKSDPKSFRSKIDRSKRVRKDFIDDKELFLNLYTNKQGNTSKNRESRRDAMQVNYIYSHIRLVSPTIYAGNPKINIRSTNGADPLASINASNLEGAINYWAKQLGAPREFNSALFDSFFGLAAVEVGWDYRTQLVEDQVPLIDPNTGAPVLGQDGLPVMVVEPVQKVKADRPFLRWRDSKDILLDIDVPRRSDGRFIIVSDVVSHDYFMQMEEIPMQLRKKVRPTVRPEDQAKDGSDIARDQDKMLASELEWVELEWIWCRETDRRYLMTPTINNEFLLDTPWPYSLNFEGDPFPITILDNITDNRWPYSYSEFRPAMEHIRELNRLRTNTLYHIKGNQPKFVYNKAAMTRAQASKLAYAKPDEYIEVNNPDGIKQAPTSEFPSETLQWNAQVEADLVKITGLVEYEGTPQAETATEASILEGRSQVRKRARSQQFERFVVGTLAKLGQLCQQNMNEQISVEINGPSGKSWRKISKQDIAGDFDYDYEAGMMEFKNEALRKQQLLKYAELMAGNPNVNQRHLAEEITQAFDFNKEKMLLPVDQIQKAPPEPMIKFKDIDPNLIPSPAVQAQIVMAAMEQNGIDPQAPRLPQDQGQMPMEPGMAPQQLDPSQIPNPMDPPTDAEYSDNYGMPMGGKVQLPPVQGMNDIQDASRGMI